MGSLRGAGVWLVAACAAGALAAGARPDQGAPEPSPPPVHLGSPPRAVLGHVPTTIPTRKKIVALTFDLGGNDGGLPKIEATLRRLRAPATFFVTGHFAGYYPQWPRRLARAGFPLANHTVDHPHLAALSDAGVRAEVTGAAQTIRRTSGRPVEPLFRFPFGEHDRRTLRIVNQLGYAAVGWTADTAGWLGTSGGQSVATVTRRALAALRPGAILTMHGGSNPTDGSTLDADALPGVIRAFRARGYRLVSLPQAYAELYPRWIAGSGERRLAQAGTAARPLAPYTGVGTWVSIYDLPALRHPRRVVETLTANGIDMLFLETANYRQQVDVVRPLAVGRLLDAAHAAGIAVVGWYLPSLANHDRDLRRALAGVRFQSPAGGTFDSFALDIEATEVRSVARRNARAVTLAAALRRAVPRNYALGAITIAPVGASPTYWPRYPFRGLAPYVDVLLPMTYFTARTSGAAGVAAYTAANLRFIRARVGAKLPLHPIGGESRKATLPELKAFLRTAERCRALGASLWEYGETSPAQWTALAAATVGRGTTDC